jgi:flavin-binding protein dodecin
LPVEKPVPVQEVALVDDHVRVDDWPDVTDVGFAESAAVGVAAVTLTVAFALADALPFEQLTE